MEEKFVKLAQFVSKNGMEGSQNDFRQTPEFLFPIISTIMDRTVPSSGNEEIQLYKRTYYSLLRSTSPVQVQALVEAHKRMNSALHVNAAGAEPDLAAFNYAMLRLPSVIDQVDLVVMGQSERIFRKHGYADLSSWERVTAPGRRRRSFYDGNGSLAVFIASRSDIDDLIPLLVAYQIERRKLYELLGNRAGRAFLQQLVQEDSPDPQAACQRLAELTASDEEGWMRLYRVWGPKLPRRLLTFATQKQSLAIRALSGSLADYKRATRQWWRHVEAATPDIDFVNSPAYFVSSNTHTLANLLSGYPLMQEAALEAYIREEGPAELQREYADILEQNVPSSRENFLYYVWKKYEKAHPHVVAERLAHERRMGIYRVPSKYTAFDIEVQVVLLRNLNTKNLDPRLQFPGMADLSDSQALIINIDYPLGMGAYQVLTEISRNIDEVRGVFIMGKAATLNGRVGDVMIPSVVHDEHSANTYLFRNSFCAEDVRPFLVYGSVLDNQKAITVPGTFLQNQEYMAVFYKEGYTDLEMEAGPYLSAIYEMSRPMRHPYNEIANLYEAPFPVGILHYASDTPFSKGENLGAQNLSYFGMDPTYATMIAILRRLLAAEWRHITP